MRHSTAKPPPPSSCGAMTTVLRVAIPLLCRLFGAAKAAPYETLSLPSIGRARAMGPYGGLRRSTRTAPADRPADDAADRSAGDHRGRDLSLGVRGLVERAEAGPQADAGTGRRPDDRPDGFRSSWTQLVVLAAGERG